jgi:hypothetical protein
MIMTTSIDYHLRYLQASLSEMEVYLKADSPDWRPSISAPSGMPPYPNLTPGTFLLARAHLKLPNLDVQDQLRLASVDQQISSLLDHWQTAWTRKANKDSSIRVNLWRNYLEDYRDSPHEQAPYYPYEVTQRVILELLIQDGFTASSTEVATLDKMLEISFIPGAYIWEPDSAPAFPTQYYWFLYGRLKND